MREKFLLGSTVILYFLACGLIWTACGSPKEKEEIIVKLPAPNVNYNCDGKAVGTQDNTLKCDAGYLGSITRTCIAKQDFATWEITDSTCRPPPSQCENDSKNKVTFVKDIKPLIEEKCIRCHGIARYNEYGSAASIARNALNLIQLGDDNPKRMPPTPSKALSFEEIKLWQDWIDDGILNDIECEQEETRNNLNYNTNDKFAAANVNAVLPLDGRGKLNARFITADTKFNEGATTEEMEIYRASINDAINLISGKEQNLQFCSSVDLINGSCRIDLESIGLTASDWEKIVYATTLVFEDISDLGLQLQLLTGSRYPTLTGAQFVEGAIANAANYYEFLEIPNDLETYLRQKGVELEQDVIDFRARFAGMSDSKVSARKNRLMTFYDSDDGKCAITFDPQDAADPESNLSSFPLLFVGEKRFKFDASEVLCTMKNGGMEGSLFNAAGELQSVAPTDIVIDFRAGGIHGDFEIKNFIACLGCHRGGWNSFDEEIKDSILSNAGDFIAEDIRIVKELYVNQTQLNGIFISNNDKFRETRKRIGIDTLKPDPITFWWDQFISSWTLDQLCGHIRINPADGCAQDLKTTSVAGDLAPLFEGRQIKKEILDRVFDTIVLELGIGENRINQ